MLKKRTKILIIIGLCVLFLILLILGSFYYLRMPKKVVKSHPLTKIELKIFNNKIEPQFFTVKAGEDIKLIIVSMEGEHQFRFENEKLSWIRADFEEPGETEEIIFRAPLQKGKYRFFCAQPGHQEVGEEGVMIVE